MTVLARFSTFAPKQNRGLLVAVFGVIDDRAFESLTVFDDL